MFPSQTVYVLGTGPNGKDHYKRIPFDAWVIGVNKAIQLQGGDDFVQPHDIHERMRVAKAADPETLSIPISIWLCADTTLPEQKWFTDEIDVTIACDFPLDNNLNPTVCLSTSPTPKKGLNLRYPDVHYYFEHGYTLREPPVFQPLPGILRAGGNIGMQAVQLAYWKGAKRIILCGFDMVGDTYFDGTKNIRPRLKPDGTSLHLRMAQGLCNWLKGQRVEVVSLSPTALDVEVV